MSDDQLQEYLEFAKGLAKEAGEIMLRYFLANDIGTIEKEDKTLVTLADTEINNLVIKRIQLKHPNHSVHGEEASIHIANAPFTWVCDPVDGTLPFAKGLPISTFSIGLVDDTGQSVVGVAFDPYQDRLYTAIKGKGAFLNGQKIQVSKRETLEGAFVDNELWKNEKEGVSFLDPREILANQGAVVTSQCSAVIMGCLVAEGLYDVMLFGQSKPEDIAALKVIVEEAGGKVTSLSGLDQRYDEKIYGAVVSNGAIHPNVLDALKDINYQSKYVDHK